MTPEDRAQSLAATIVELLNVLRLSRQDQENYEAVVKEIAVALREEYARGYKDAFHAPTVSEFYHKRAVKEADAEGYRRGFEVGKKDGEIPF
jgi:hypothetical protein